MSQVFLVVTYTFQGTIFDLSEGIGGEDGKREPVLGGYALRRAAFPQLGTLARDSLSS